MKSLKQSTAEMTYEESFRAITKPLDLDELEVHMHLYNPLVIALVKQLKQTQKLKRQMAELFQEKMQEVETSFLLLEKAQKEFEEKSNWVDIDEDEPKYFVKTYKGRRIVNEKDFHSYI